jgi:hypothetical protein
MIVNSENILELHWWYNGYLSFSCPRSSGQTKKELKILDDKEKLKNENDKEKLKGMFS